MKTLACLLPLALAAAVATPAAAQSQTGYFDLVRPDPPGVPANRLRVGASLLSGAAWPGARERDTRPWPLLDWRGEGFFASTVDGLGWGLRPDCAVNFGPRITVDTGRSERRHDRLRGWGHVPMRAEAGLFASAAPWAGGMLGASWRHGSTAGGGGDVVDLGAGQSVPLGGDWFAGVEVVASWADARHERAYFGIDAAQSAASGLAPHAIGAGWRDLRSSLSLVRLIAPGLAAVATLRDDRLLGATRDSPVSERDRSTALIATLAWTF